MNVRAVGIIAALCFSAAIVSAQFAPPAIVPTGKADVDRHVEAAKAAAGTEWTGLYTAVCGDAVGLAQPPAPRAGGARRGGGGGGARRAGGPPDDEQRGRLAHPTATQSHFKVENAPVGRAD